MRQLVQFAVTGTTVLATAAAVPRAAVDAPAGHAAADGLGQLSGLLSLSKFTVGSLIDINLSNESARLPIYPGTAPNPLTGQARDGLVHLARCFR